MDEICDFCKKRCHGKWEDFGIGHTEFWGSVSVHTDMRYVSSCCDAPLDPPGCEDYFDPPNDYWEDE